MPDTERGGRGSQKLEGGRVFRGPRSCYEEGKRFGEALCKAYRDQYGIDVRIARIFNSYGPGLRAEGFYGRLVSRFLLLKLVRLGRLFTGVRGLAWMKG